jgi:hypothetical protein
MNKNIQFSHSINTRLINHSDNDTADMIELMSGEEQGLELLCRLTAS